MNNSKVIGGILLPFRLVTSWLFLSAVLRRLVLAPAKHDMESAKWIGHKINTFFPQANGVFHTILEYLSRNPVEMNWFSYLFTYSELLVGVLLLLGIASRITGVLLISLGVGLMHTAGWLGPTCLDEWQIASLLTTVGVVISIFGSGDYSMDSFLNKRKYHFTTNKFWNIITSPTIIVELNNYSKIITLMSVSILLYVIGTNQLLHGGVWGSLHNDSVKPNIIISEVENTNGYLSFFAFRDKGLETYGAFIVEIEVLDKNNTVLKKLNANDFQNVTLENVYINKASKTERSLVFPLGSKAGIKIKNVDFSAKEISIKMLDISGRTFLSK